MPRFAVVVVARNEAQSLRRLMESLRAFLDAGGVVHLVDTGSSDGTAAVAASLGCCVHQAGDRFASVLSEAEAAAIDALAVETDRPVVQAGQRLFHFAAAREFASSLPAEDVVLHLDGSDEVLALDLDALERRLASGNAGALGCAMVLGDGQFMPVRFYDRRWYRWEGRTHEALYPRPGQPAATIPPTEWCGGHELRLVHHRQEKERTYLAGLALDLLDHPEQPRWVHYVGRELYYGRAYRSALVWLLRHADRAEAPALERSQSLLLAGECHEWLGDPVAADRAYARAADVAPVWRGPLLRRAALASTRGHFALAAACAEQALTVPGPSTVAEPDASYSWWPHALLYWSLFWLGRRDEAARHWEVYQRLAPALAQATGHARWFDA